MKKRDEQKILTIIIIVAVIALAILTMSIMYEEQIKKNKNVVENVEIKEDELEKDYVGEEEQEINDTEIANQAKSNDEKAIDLAKKEWGEDDSVTFSIEEKKENKYYIAVKQEATVIGWYEVDIESWKISEY